MLKGTFVQDHSNLLWISFMNNQECLWDNENIFINTRLYTIQDQHHQINSSDMCNSILDHITKQLQYNVNKACIRVNHIKTYAIPLPIFHYESYKCNDQVKSYNPTQPSKPNKES